MIFGLIRRSSDFDDCRSGWMRNFGITHEEMAEFDSAVYRFIDKRFRGENEQHKPFAWL